MATDFQERVWDAYGYRIKFRWSLPEFEQLVDRVILPDWKVCDSPCDAVFTVSGESNTVSLERDGEPLISGLAFDSAIDSLRRSCQLHLATYCQRFVFVHAGVVLAPEGLVVMPGGSYCGKSTLVRALVDAGCHYFSDEYALVDSDGAVHAFPRPLRERLGPFDSKFTPAQELGWRVGLSPQPPRLILFTRFEEHGSWDPEEVSSATAVLKALEHTVCARPRPEQSLKFLKPFTLQAECLYGARGDAQSTSQQILNRL
jgi:hypothetical protein